MNGQADEKRITRKNAVFPLDEKAPELLKIQMFLAPLMLIMTLSIIRGASSNVLSMTINQMGAGNFYSTAVLLWSLCNTCVIPIGGKLSDLIGRKKWLAITTPIYIISVIGCGLASNIELLVFFYALMGLSFGLLNNFQNVLMADLMTGAPRTRYMGFLNSGSNIASMVAPMLAGIIADLGFAQLSFVIMAPLAIITWLLILWLVPDVKYTDKKPVIDIIGIVLVIATLVPFTLALSQGGKLFSWTSPICIFMLILPFFTGYLFFRYEQKFSEPLIDFSLFKLPGFTPLVTMNLFSQTFAMLTMVYMIRYCQDVLGYTAVQTGVFSTSRLLSIFLGPIVATWLGRSGKYKLSLLTSGAIQLVSAVAFIIFLRPGMPFIIILMLQYLFNLGIVFKQTPEVAYMSEILPETQMGMGLSAQVMFAGMSGTIITAVCGMFMNMYDNDISKAMFPMLYLGLAMQIVYFLIATRLHNIKRAENK